MSIGGPPCWLAFAAARAALRRARSRALRMASWISFWILASCFFSFRRALRSLLLGLEGHRLGVLAVADQALHPLLGVEGLLGQPLHRDEVVGGLLALLGDLGRRLLDLVLVDLEQHLGRAQVVVLVVLPLDERAAGLALPGDVGRASAR